MTILSFDTCIPLGSVALVDGYSVLSSSSWNAPREHASRIFVEIERVLSLAGRTFDDVDLVVSTAGPGSFTGIRISLSAAKALSVKKKVVTVSTLEACSAFCLGDEVLSVLKAMRGKVYALCMVNRKRVFGPLDIRIEELIERVKGFRNLKICGNALEDEEIRGVLGDFGTIVEPYSFPLSVGAAIYAENFGYSERIEPIYVRPHDARRSSSKGV